MFEVLILRFSVETAQHVSKVVTWKRSVSSLSSSSKSPLTAAMITDDVGDSNSDFVEQFAMVSGSHSSTLDRLHAWERKLHDEIKVHFQYMCTCAVKLLTIACKSLLLAVDWEFIISVTCLHKIFALLYTSVLK